MMAYTGTTNYGFQKPDKENAFTVNDLNNALDKIDETIKDESPSALSVDVDEDMNLIVKLTNGKGSEIEGSTSLARLTGMLIITDTILYTNMTVIKTSNNQSFYNGPIEPCEIECGSGSFKITITQFGNTLEKIQQVSGETVLDLSNDFVTVTPQAGTVSWSIGDVPINSSTDTIKVLKDKTSIVKVIFGKWDNAHDITATKSTTFASDMTIDNDYSDVYYITSSGTFTIPLSKTYEYIMCGGGGGGGGGASGYRSDATYGGPSGGNGGDGGYGGGTGGAKGTGGLFDDSGSHVGVSGGNGGATIFNNHSVSGGNGGSYGRHLNTSQDGGDGGSGGGGSSMNIYGSYISGGTAGSAGRGGTIGTSTIVQPTSGGKGGIPEVSAITWVSNIGRGGNGGRGGSVSRNNYANGGSSGTGGYGFDGYGRGGSGGNGGSARFSTSTTYNSGTNGSTGSNGCVAIRVVL